MGTVETIAGGSSKQKADVVEDELTSNRRKRKSSRVLWIFLVMGFSLSSSSGRRVVGFVVGLGLKIDCCSRMEKIEKQGH